MIWNNIITDTSDIKEQLFLKIIKIYTKHVFWVNIMGTRTTLNNNLNPYFSKKKISLKILYKKIAQTIFVISAKNRSCSLPQFGIRCIP